jgi:hypothetical protein
MSDSRHPDLRAVITAAVHGRQARVVGRLRIAVVGVEEERFLVELAASTSVVRDDDSRPADATLWIRNDDVPRLLAGWDLGGVRRAGRCELIEALVALLEPGKSPLALQVGDHRAHK